MKNRSLLLMICMLLLAALIPAQALAADPLKIEVTGVPAKLNVGDDAPTPEDITVMVGDKAAKIEYVGLDPLLASSYDYTRYQEGGKITEPGDYAIIISIQSARAQYLGVSGVTVNGAPAAEFGSFAHVEDSFWEDGEKFYALDVGLDDFIAREVRAIKENGNIYVDTYLSYDGTLEIKCFITVGTETSPEAGAGSFPFSDVPADAYYHDAVAWAYGHEPQITDGTSATTFSPDKTCTRGQVVTFLWRAAGCPEPEATENPFADVSESDYFYKPVLWAVEKGITDGTTPTTFSPGSTCKNSHILTFIYRAVGEP